MIMSHLFFYLKLQEPDPEIHTIESIVQVMSISVAELCFVVFIWVRSESIWKAYLSSSYIRLMRWMMNVLGALIFIQQVPKIIQWTRNDTSRPLAIAVILSSVLVAFFIFALDAIFLSVFLKVLKKQDEHVTEQSEFPILAKYGIGQLLMGCFALISLIVASILGANHEYYNLAYGITYMFMNGIFCVAIAMKIALYRRAKRLEAKNTKSGGKSGEKKRKRKMFFEKSQSMILPSGRKSIDQGGAIGMYTVPFSTIQEGDSSAEQSILNDGEKEKRSERSSKAQASVIIEMDRRSERSSQNR
ncbi:hypothetical protein BDR26DRAFT_853313 [Obelidium mucronatum]|nr:hypothetical protein BDR26DRAFT_853313 [Obelidium mucronatum]